MAVLSKDAPSPTEVKLHQTSRVLEITTFDGGSEIQLHDPMHWSFVWPPSGLEQSD